jgi:hypothetical protein
MRAVSIPIFLALFFVSAANAGQLDLPPDYEGGARPETSRSASKLSSTIERKFIKTARPHTAYIINGEQHSEKTTRQKTTTEDSEDYVRRQIAKHGAPIGHSSETKEMGVAGKLKIDNLKFKTGDERITKKVTITTQLPK